VYKNPYEHPYMCIKIMPQPEDNIIREEVLNETSVTKISDVEVQLF